MGEIAGNHHFYIFHFSRDSSLRYLMVTVAKFNTTVPLDKGALDKGLMNTFPIFARIELTKSTALYFFDLATDTIENMYT